MLAALAVLLCWAGEAIAAAPVPAGVALSLSSAQRAWFAPHEREASMRRWLGQDQAVPWQRRHDAPLLAAALLLVLALGCAALRLYLCQARRGGA